MPQERGEFPGRRHDSNLAVSAAHYVQQFCHENAIDCGGQLVTGGRVSATCLEESGPPVKALLFHARHSDLVVLGRRQHADGMPATLVEDLLMGSGRPMLLVPPTVRRELLGNVIIGWKEGSQAARALTAALPLLRLAKQVFLVNVAEDDATSTQALEQVRQQLAWHEISAQVQRIADGSASASTLLSRTAEELKAGLLVVGGFSHSRIRETMFGGVTRSLIDDASLPVLMVH
jgi:nucleotide-binding universal stress UspA family protein